MNIVYCLPTCNEMVQFEKRQTPNPYPLGYPARPRSLYTAIFVATP